jgi:hypothetical protein
VPIITAVRIAIFATSFAFFVTFIVVLLGTWGILARFEPSQVAFSTAKHVPKLIGVNVSQENDENAENQGVLAVSTLCSGEADRRICSGTQTKTLGSNI